MIRFPKLNDTLRSISTKLQQEHGITADLAIADSGASMLAEFSHDHPLNMIVFLRRCAVIGSAKSEYSEIGTLVTENFQSLRMITDKRLESVYIMNAGQSSPSYVFIISISLASGGRSSLVDYVGVTNSVFERVQNDLLPLMKSLCLQ